MNRVPTPFDHSISIIFLVFCEHFRFNQPINLKKKKKKGLNRSIRKQIEPYYGMQASFTLHKSDILLTK